MDLHRRQLILAASAAAALPAARAQAYPAKTVRLIVPYPAGSTLDLVARIFTDGFSRHFGQSAIVVNQPGGSAAIGTRAGGRHRAAAARARGAQ